MARRPLHLRWIYIQDHAPTFAAVTASLAFGMILVVVLTEDPIQGLLLGALPAVFGLVVWTITNQAGYPSRHPESLPHERPEVPDTAGPEGEEAREQPSWDPFEGQRRTVVVPPDEANQAAAADSGDPFASTAPAVANSPPVNEKRASKANRARSPRESAEPGHVPAAPPDTSASLTENPRGSTKKTAPPSNKAAPKPPPPAKPRTPGKQSDVEVLGPGQPSGKKPSAPGASTKTPSDPAAADGQTVKPPASAAERPPASETRSPAPDPPDTGPERPAKADKKTKATAKPSTAAASPSADGETNRSHDGPGATSRMRTGTEELLSPAEAAKRAAAARKRSSRRRGGRSGTA